MTRHRTTYITDDDGKVEHGSYVVEDIPEPNRVQEFRVRVTSPAAEDPITRDGIVDLLTCEGCRLVSDYVATVTEVDPS